MAHDDGLFRISIRNQEVTPLNVVPIATSVEQFGADHMIVTEWTTARSRSFLIRIEGLRIIKEMPFAVAAVAPNLKRILATRRAAPGSERLMKDGVPVPAPWCFLDESFSVVSEFEASFWPKDNEIRDMHIGGFDWKGLILECAFTPDGEFAVIVENARMIVVRETSTGKAIQMMDPYFGETGIVSSVTLDHTGTYLITGGQMNSPDPKGNGVAVWERVK